MSKLDDYKARIDAALERVKSAMDSEPSDREEQLKARFYRQRRVNDKISSENASLKEELGAFRESQERDQKEMESILTALDSVLEGGDDAGS